MQRSTRFGEGSQFVCRARARVWLRSHSGCAWAAALVVCVVGAASASSAQALEVAPASREAPTFSLELRALGGGAAVGLAADDEPVVDFDATAFGLGARLGWFADPHLQIGATASIVRYSRAGEIEVRNAEIYADEFWLRETSYTLWSPIGAFIEMYPFRGFSVGVSGSLGYVPAPTPPPGTITSTLYMAGYALELGYDTSRLERHGAGVFLRYAAWTGGESPLHTDFPDSIASSELTLGARWTFRP